MKIVLASASPRRIELIKKLEYLEVEVKAANIEEKTEEKTASAAVMDLARQKALAVRDSGVKDLILAADTMVVIGDKKLGKPLNAEAARDMFKLLCGKTHSVLTGICLLRGNKIISDFSETKVTFNEYKENIIEEYISLGKPFDKAGGYGIQDAELREIVSGIKGEYDNVLGLPVAQVDRLLRENFI